MEAEMRESGSMRQRYFVFVSVIYIALGVVIVVRSVLAEVIPIAILGVVFIALGAVRIRDFLMQRERTE
jgi:uncharacterized membrane protein HdeD (DUF308 family)